MGGPIVGKGGQYGLWLGSGANQENFVKTGALFLGVQASLTLGVWRHVVATTSTDATGGSWV